MVVANLDGGMGLTSTYHLGVDDANINDDHDIDSVMVFLASLALTTCIIW